MIAALLIAAVLAGSSKPLVVRDGAWGVPCEKDETDCTVIVVKDGAMVGLVDGQVVRRPLRFVPGNPPLMQMEADNLGDFIDLNEAADAPQNYVGVRINARDARGRITSLSFWPVWCEVPPDGKTSKQVGVRWDAARHACIVDGKAAIRAASADDRIDLYMDLLTYQWLREARPEDLGPLPEDDKE